MALEPPVQRRPWDRTLIQRWLRDTGRVLAVTVLCGVLTGIGITLASLSDFSYLPSFFGYVIALVAGGYIGLLTRRLNHGLVALLLATLVSAAVSTLALAYPEFQVHHLGLEVAVELSALQGLTGSVLAVPLLIVGLLLGKLISRFE
jgi:hypothetical protein